MFNSLTDAWNHALMTVAHTGLEISPRQQTTFEILHNTVAFDMQRPVITTPERKLNYQFMAAEAFWIITGDDRADQIIPFNKNIAKFSDDGETFFGAYGPPFMDQVDYIVDKLVDDPMSRQAVLTIWRQNPPQTKDMPCTVAMSFDIRGNKLNQHVFMRSSDVWLGLPYDGFTFSMMGYLVCGMLRNAALMIFKDLEPGTMFITAASQHLYERNMEDAMTVITTGTRPEQERAPSYLWEDPMHLPKYLGTLRFTKPGDRLRWWEAK